MGAAASCMPLAQSHTLNLLLQFKSGAFVPGLPVQACGVFLRLHKSLVFELLTLHSLLRYATHSTTSTRLGRQEYNWRSPVPSHVSSLFDDGSHWHDVMALPHVV